jgi:hypothetical protein
LNERPEIPIDEPAIDVSYQLPLDDGSGRVVVFRSLVPQTCSDEHFNEVLDKFSRAAERQKAKAVLPSYENQLAETKEALIIETQALFSAREEMTQLQTAWDREARSSTRRNWQPTAQQKAAGQKLEATIKQHEQTIRVLEKKIVSEAGRVQTYKSRLGAGE